jgi:ribonuclease HI
MKEKIIIYTDGGCDPNPGPGGWGYILILSDHEKIEGFGGDTDTTNNRMELTAVLEALNILKEPCEISLFSDSKYVVNGINSWIDSWIRSDFRQNKIKNKDLWLRIHDYKLHHDIHAYWVRGHSGVVLNERADQLAEKGRLKAMGVEWKELPKEDYQSLTIQKHNRSDKDWSRLLKYLKRNKWDFS